MVGGENRFGLPRVALAQRLDREIDERLGFLGHVEQSLLELRELLVKMAKASLSFAGRLRLRHPNLPVTYAFGTLFTRVGEYLIGWSRFDQASEEKECGVVGDACRLLQVVRHDDDRQLLLQLVQQLFDALRRDRIERARRLVEQKHFRLVRERARDAQTLLLAAGETRRALAQSIADLFPERRAPQRRLDDEIELAPVANAVDARSVGDVRVDRFRKRIPSLKDHPDALPQRDDVDAMNRTRPRHRARCGPRGERRESAR